MFSLKEYLIFGIITLSSSLAFAQGQTNAANESEQQDNNLPFDAGTIDISGISQSRYEYTFVKDNDDLSSFYLRRMRVEFRGNLFGEQLTFQVRPEFARSVGLEDAWINYAYNQQTQIRFGLIYVPFHWYRFISSSRHHFVERGLPSESFGFPGGRDFGIMFHGQNESNTINYKVGIVDGAGANVVKSNSNGNVISGRISAATLGELPRDETGFENLAEPNLSVGFGVQAANKNEVRDWALGRSAFNNNRADWITGTGDVSLRWMGFSLTADAFLRTVNPDAADVDNYTGWAYTTSTGYFIRPQKLELVARYSDLRLDANDPDTNESEVGVGLNMYHREHNLKTRIQYLSQFDQTYADFGEEAYLIVEVQVLF